MIQITPQMRMLVAIEPADFRKGIDGLARLCQETLKQDPLCGWVFVFRNRQAFFPDLRSRLFLRTKLLYSHPHSYPRFLRCMENDDGSRNH